MTMEETLNPKVLWVVGRKGGDAELAGGSVLGREIYRREDVWYVLGKIHRWVRRYPAYLTASFVVDSLVRANRLEQDKTPVFFFMHRVLSW
jgi:hypothetical protein